MALDEGAPVCELVDDVLAVMEDEGVPVTPLRVAVTPLRVAVTLDDGVPVCEPVTLAVYPSEADEVALGVLDGSPNTGEGVMVPNEALALASIV